MRRGWMRYLLAMLAAAVLLPAAALAGKKVVSGQQSLQLKVSLKPARAGAATTVHLHSVYLNTKSNQQPPYNTDQTIFALPKGMGFHPRVAASCRESVVLKGGACPAKAKVGTGSVTINARPTIAQLIHGSVTVFNGLDDGGYGYPKGSRELMLLVKTSGAIKLTETDFFHVVKTPSGYRLVGTSTKPAKAGTAPGDYSLQVLDLTTSSTAHPLWTNPKQCTGSWGFSLRVTNYFGQPSVTARDRVSCRR